MFRTKWAAAAALFIIAALAGWYFYSPAYTLQQMKAAAKANDSDKFSSYIDFPKLREDMKSELMARMMEEEQKDKSGLGSFGMVIGSAMIGPIVDGMVSPAGVRAAFLANEKNKADKTAMQSLKLSDEPVIERRGFSEFAVTSKDHSNGAMIFKRHGLGWQLSGIELPPDTDTGTKPQTATTAPSVQSPEQQELHQLDAFNLAIGLKRAIYDSGYTCKRVTDAGFVGAWKNLDMWMAHCVYDKAAARDWAIFAGPDGSAQVRDCKDVVAFGLPACVINERPAGRFF